jgi:hypothetical protein
MASIRNRGDKWQARKRRLGQNPITKLFQNKQDAERWARQVEFEMQTGSYSNLVLDERTTLQKSYNAWRKGRLHSLKGFGAVRPNRHRTIGSCDTKNAT